MASVWELEGGDTPETCLCVTVHTFPQASQSSLAFLSRGNSVRGSLSPLMGAFQLTSL